MKHAATYNEREASRAIPRTVANCRLSNPVLYPEHYATMHAPHNAEVMRNRVSQGAGFGGCLFDPAEPVTMHYVVGLPPDTIRMIRDFGDDVTDNWRMVTCVRCLDGKHRP